MSSKEKKMEFLDKLQALLIDSDNIYCTTYYYGDNNENKFKHLVLEINAHELNCSRNKQSYIKRGIIDMISYLKDPIHNKSNQYTQFFLNLSHNNLLEKINELNPTDEDLIHLYKYASHGFTFSLFQFFPFIKKRENILNIIKLGHDYTHNWDNRQSECFKDCLEYTKKFELTEDELTEVVFNYIKNSKNIIEAEQERNIVALCNHTIKDKNKCRELIKDVVGKDIQIQTNNVEKEVIKIEIDDSFFVRKYGFINPYLIEVFLSNFTKNIKANIELLNHTINVDYYQNNIHNLIVESINGTNEINDILEVYLKYYIENKDDFNMPQDYFKYLVSNPEVFQKMILNVILNQSLEKKIENNKVIKV
jgi:hypothetical protein